MRPSPPINPIRPDQVRCRIDFPEEVIQAFNDCIQKHWNGQQADIPQEAVLVKIAQEITYRYPRMTEKELREMILRYEWLEAIERYRGHGWKVYRLSTSFLFEPE